MTSLAPRSTRITRNLQSPSRPIWQNFDIPLLGTALLLLVIGVAMIRSTTLNNIELTGLEQTQIRWAAIGLVVMLVVTAIDYRLYRSMAFPLYIFVLIWLGAIFAVGLVSFGAQRWLLVLGLNIQPAEAAKIASLVWVAAFFAQYRDRLGDLRYVIFSGIYAGVPIIMVLLQPSLSNSIILMVIWFAIAWAAGLRWQHIALGAVIALVLTPVFWGFMEEYQRLRVLQFINPSLDPGAQYNIDQALISIGSGGLFGQGYNSASQVQLRFLKVRHTDFIFAATAAEFGLLGSSVLIILEGILIWRVLVIARKAADAFGAYICYGFAALLFFQTVINVGMNMNIMPVTGLPLPFVSYGGSSLLTFFAALGLVQSVALRHKVNDF